MVILAESTPLNGSVDLVGALVCTAGRSIRPPKTAVLFALRHITPLCRSFTCYSPRRASERASLLRSLSRVGPKVLNRTVLRVTYRSTSGHFSMGRRVAAAAAAADAAGARDTLISVTTITHLPLVAKRQDALIPLASPSLLALQPH